MEGELIVREGRIVGPVDLAGAAQILNRAVA